MEQINFRSWRLVASVVDAGILRLEIEALDGSDIVEMGGPEAEREGEQYSLHLSSQGLEEAQKQRGRRATTDNGHESEDDEPGASWPADEDETLYLRGWEVDALVDEDGLLSVTVERGEGAEIYEIEPLESGIALSPRIIVRLAAEETDEEEEGEDEGEEDEQETEDAFEDFDQLDELDDGYQDDLEDENDDLDDEDLFPDSDEEDLY